MRIREEN